MATTLHHGQEADVGEIIDAVMETDAPDEEKQDYLLRIQQEGGICSMELREDLALLFENQAAQERRRREERKALLDVQYETPSEFTPDLVEEAEDNANIVADITAQQAAVLRELDDGATKMRGDVMTMDRHAAQTQEKQHAAGEHDEMEE